MAGVPRIAEASVERDRRMAERQAGNHDNRVYEDDWAEKWQGLLVKKPDGTTNYDDQANQKHARNLKGKLLLAHGAMDDNVPPYNTYLVVDELIKANKDFDLVMIPNAGHLTNLEQPEEFNRIVEAFIAAQGTA